MAIALDTFTTHTDGSNPAGNPFTWSHTCTGSNLVLFVTIASPNSITSPVCTYSGNTMTLVRTDSNTGAVFVYSYLLVTPNTGSNTVSFSWTGGISPAGLSAGALSLTGCRQTSQPDAHNGANGTLTSPATASVTTTTDNCWVVGGVSSTAANTLTISVGTQAWQVADSQPWSRSTGGYTGPKTPAGAQSLAWTESITSWSMGVLSIAPYIIVPITPTTFYPTLKVR